MKTGIGVGANQLNRVIEYGVGGIVVERSGVRNTTEALGNATRVALESNIPVVVTSRCQNGTVAPVYGATGGSKQLRSSGAIFAGTLSAHKARIKLMLLTQKHGTKDLTKLRHEFDKSQ